jgi:predicted ATP-grasp superfamily ATP-dependent carboligase
MPGDLSAPWVLVTDDVNGQNRSAVSAVRALAHAGYRPAVSTCGPSSVGAASRYCERRVTVPAASHPEYKEAIRHEASTGGYLTVMPASDVALVALGAPGAELVDKAILGRRADDAGIATLPGRVFRSAAELRNAADELAYPVVVKAVLKSGKGDFQARRIDSAQALRSLDAPGTLFVQPHVSETLRAVAGVVWDRQFLALSHQRYVRLWPRQAGVGSAAMTVPPDEALEAPLLNLLGDHQGVFQAQFLGPYLLDVNPRVFGSMPLAFAAGLNLPGIACGAARGNTQPLARARPGVRYRWAEGDIRHLFSAVRAKDMSVGRAMRELVPHRRTAHSLESLTDPRPGLVRLATLARKARS